MKYYQRQVLVVFKQNVSSTLLEAFYQGLELVKENAVGLVYFELIKNTPLAGEHVLNEMVPDVFFPDVMTIWRFNKKEALEDFIASSFHAEIARTRFKPAVEKRVVFNCVV